MRKGYGFDDVLIIPQFSNVGSRTEPDVKTWFCKDVTIGFPILVANMDVTASLEMRDIFISNGGGFIHHRFVNPKNVNPGEFITVGMRDYNESTWWKNVHQLCDYGINICFDIAHAHCEHVLSAVRELKASGFGNKIIVGNIATSEAARDFCMAGVDALKVGIGPGFSCSTRLVTGVGYPQISAIMECSEVCKKFHVPVIADGGIASSAHVAKAIAAGASSVMVGSLFAGCDEAAGKWCGEYGEPVTRCTCHGDPMSDENATNHNERFHVDINYNKEYLEYAKVNNKHLHRIYWGQSSEDFQHTWLNGVKPGVVPEGFTTYVPYCGSALDVIKDLIGGLKSAMSYVGSKTISEFQRKAEFIETVNIKEN
jgi:IMP dehydrogenase